METAGSHALTLVYKVTANALRVKLIESIDGDVSLENLKYQLQTEFEKLNEKLDRILKIHVKVAQENIRDYVLWNRRYSGSQSCVRFSASRSDSRFSRDKET